MAQEKYQQLVKIVRDIYEKNANTELDCLKLLFKKFVFGEKEIPAMQELWFEKKEIKDDAEYYQLIHSLISSFIIHCSDKRLKADMLTKDIFTLFENTKYFNIYSNFIEISDLFGLGDPHYIDIGCGLYNVGLKKGTPVNSILIEILKDFSEEEIIKESRYYSQIKSVNYENISESFMKNLFVLYNLIISKTDE